MSLPISPFPLINLIPSARVSCKEKKDTKIEKFVPPKIVETLVDDMPKISAHGSFPDIQSAIDFHVAIVRRLEKETK
jgi:hypothetical protein